MTTVLHFYTVLIAENTLLCFNFTSYHLYFFCSEMHQNLCINLQTPGPPDSPSFAPNPSNLAMPLCEVLAAVPQSDDDDDDTDESDFYIKRRVVNVHLMVRRNLKMTRKQMIRKQVIRSRMTTRPHQQLITLVQLPHLTPCLPGQIVQLFHINTCPSLAALVGRWTLRIQVIRKNTFNFCRYRPACTDCP